MAHRKQLEAGPSGPADPAGLKACPPPVRRFLVAICLASFAVAAVSAARARSVWDGVYTKAQATRGKTVYTETCTRCHGETFLGGDDAKPLVGDVFFERWDGKPVFLMFDITRRKMPDDGPAVLSRAQTADVVAYLLAANGFPAGTAELATEDVPLKEILITKKKP